MIETKTLGSAVGVQRGDVIDNSESTSLPSLANGVITGKFKRGRMDKPFKVTARNYRALLGYEPSNPSYMAVEDAFERGISEISVVRVGSFAKKSEPSLPDVGGNEGDGGSDNGGNEGSSGSINCTPTTIAMTQDSSPSAVQPTKITMAVNNNPAKTLSNPSDMLEIISTLYFAPDGTSFAFLDSTSVGIAPDDTGTKSTIRFSGLSKDGVLFGDTLYDLKNGFAPHGSDTLFVNEIVPEANTVTITRTNGVDPSDDMYYHYGGNDAGDPIILSSCAKAIVAPPCTPKSARFRDDYYPDFTQIASVHARYRVDNGVWVDYTDTTNPSSTQAGLITRFLDSIRSDGNKLIATSYDPETYSTPFYCPGGEIEILGGANPSDPMVSAAQQSFDKAMSTKIEFAATADSFSDLVNVMFDGNQTITSCASVFWAYR